MPFKTSSAFLSVLEKWEPTEHGILELQKTLVKVILPSSTLCKDKETEVKKIQMNCSVLRILIDPRIKP